MSDTDFRFALQQIEGRQLLGEKVPELPENWWYPPRLSCEQCSSALTAEYKGQLLQAVVSPECTLYDLTGGAGIDTFFLSQVATSTHYVEQSLELCHLAEHNFSDQAVTVHQTTAEQFLSSVVLSASQPVIFMDPARRDTHGNKVFRLEDCSPNAVEILQQLGDQLSRCIVMLKLSPMLDLSAALNALPGTFETHVVAVKNEVKELLLIAAPSITQPTITAIDLTRPQEVFRFTREQETTEQSQYASSPQAYLYEPSAAVLKAGAYKLVGQRYALGKLDANTHLYMSDEVRDDFPGRCWRIISTQIPKDLTEANVLTRNYVLTPEQLKKKLHLKDGGNLYVIGARISGKPCLFYAERVK